MGPGEQHLRLSIALYVCPPHTLGGCSGRPMVVPHLVDRDPWLISRLTLGMPTGYVNLLNLSLRLPSLGVLSCFLSPPSHLSSSTQILGLQANKKVKESVVARALGGKTTPWSSKLRLVFLVQKLTTWSLNQCQTSGSGDKTQSTVAKSNPCLLNARL